MCTDLDFKFPPEIVNHLSTFGILILTNYHLGHTNSNFEYYLGWVVCEFGCSNRFLRLEYTTQFLPRFSPDLQSKGVDASCRKSEPVRRFEFTDFIENHIVYDDH